MTKEEILKNKLKNINIDNPDYTFNKIIEAMEEYAQSIVLGKLPGYDDELRKVSHEIFPYPTPCSVGKSIAIDAYRLGAIEGLIKMRTIATQSIRTEDEVTKPYRELLEEVRAYAIPPQLRQRINQLLKP